MSEYRNYRKKGVQPMRPYDEGEDMAGIAVNAVDAANGSPKLGNMIAQSTANPEDRWLVAAKFFADNYEPAE